MNSSTITTHKVRCASTRTERTKSARGLPRRAILASFALCLAFGVALVAGQVADAHTSDTQGEQPRGDAPAPWLVMTNGERLELTEPWRLDASGKRVFFRADDGVLKAVRANEVNFAASQMGAAKKPPSGPAKTAGERPERAALVLEDGDVATFDRSAASASPGTVSGTQAESQPEASSPSQSGAKERLEVVSYSDVSDEGSETVVIYGTLKNNGTRTANRVSVRVALLDERGEALASGPARLVRTDISAGKTSNFQVTFVTPTPYASVEFKLGQQ